MDGTDVESRGGPSRTSSKDFTEEEAFEIRKGFYHISGWCVVFPGLILLLVLLPLSFSTLEYYQYGLQRRKSTGTMDMKKGVFDGGRYLLGPDYTFKAFQADGHRVEFRNLSVFSGDKLETLLDLDFVYFLDKARLVELHNTYERHYAPVVEGRATDAIKNAAPKYRTDFFFSSRLDLEQAFLLAVRQRLAEVFCTVDLLYLQRVKIPDEVAERQLKTAVQLEANLREQYVQNATIFREQTDREVNDINNNATIVQETANTNATLLIATATAQSREITDRARQKGLLLMYSALNITTSEHKASLDYIRTLQNLDTAQLHVGYNTKISTFNN